MPPKTHWQEKMDQKIPIPCPRCLIRAEIGLIPKGEVKNIPYRLVRKKIYLCSICNGNKREKCSGCGAIYKIKDLSYETKRCHICFEKEEGFSYYNPGGMCFRCESAIGPGCDCCDGGCNCYNNPLAKHIYYF